MKERKEFFALISVVHGGYGSGDCEDCWTRLLNLRDAHGGSVLEECCCLSVVKFQVDAGCGDEAEYPFCLSFSSSFKRQASSWSSWIFLKRFSIIDCLLLTSSANSVVFFFPSLQEKSCFQRFEISHVCISSSASSSSSLFAIES